MNQKNKEEVMKMFEKHLDEIMSADKLKFFDMSKIIKDKVLNIGDRILEDWTTENIRNPDIGNTITKYDDTLKKSSFQI